MSQMAIMGHHSSENSLLWNFVMMEIGSS